MLSRLCQAGLLLAEFQPLQPRAVQPFRTTQLVFITLACRYLPSTNVFG
jgi:hypothetical protein